MPLTVGTRIGPYEVVAHIGAGGMGEVYRARDTKLHRDVALKVLPAAFTADADRVARFEREAQALAALNHPGIAQIYGIEGDGRAIVMELVDGATLAEVIAGAVDLAPSGSEARQAAGVGPRGNPRKGGLPLDDALAIARQIASALEAAHDAGIIHRDLKPGNIKVRGDGTVKVLDFGLAKAIQADGTRPDMTPANSPTLTARATELGVILGTAAYMAPEQAKGRAVDRRADVWAFGAVLFEMLTGRRAFGGEDVTEIMAAVIRDTPQLDALPTNTPAAVRRLLRRCLEKDPRKRLRDMGDVGMELDEAMSATPGQALDEPRAISAVGSSLSRRTVLLLAAGVASLVAIAGLAAWHLKPTVEIDRSLTRFTVVLPAGQDLINYNIPNLAISRDGRRFAYRTTSGIFVRNIDEVESRAVAKAAGSGVWFSPDGQWLLYGNTYGLSKVPVTGGGGQDVAAAAQLLGADWADDGTILFSTTTAIARVPEAGGPPQTLVGDQSSSAIVGWPQLLPGGKFLLYTKATPGPQGEAAAVSTIVRSLEDGTEQVVLAGVGGTRYLETGHLVYGQETRLVVVAFDLRTRAVTGKPVPMPETVDVSTQTAWAQAAISRTGTLVYVPDFGAQTQSRLVWVDPQGKTLPAATLPRVYSDPQLSPDGRRVALHLWDEENDVWVADLARGGLTRVTFTPSEEETPIWSPDGRELAYAASRPGELRVLYLRSADGSAAAVERKLWERAEHFHVNDWSPDGRTIVVEVRQPATLNDLFAIDVQTGKEKVLLASKFAEGQARFSRDGKWLAYSSNESGRYEVYVQPYPALDRRALVSTGGGNEPVWSRDNRRLFFRSPTDIMAADVSSTSPLEFSAPRTIVPDKFVRTQGDVHTHFDVDAGGRLLLIESLRSDQDQAPVLVHVALNWTETVKRLAPTGR